MERQERLARLFEMGEYNENMWRLELATAEQDGDTAADVMEKLLESCRTLGNYGKVSLFEHMGFKEVSEEFYRQLEENLRKGFRDEDTYGWLRGNERWEAITAG